MNRLINVSSPAGAGRVSVFFEEAESPMPIKHPLDTLVSSLRFGEELCQGGQEDRQALYELAKVGFFSPGASEGNISEETTRKITQIQQKIIQNPSDKTILKDIRNMLTGLAPQFIYLGPVGTPTFVPVSFMSIAGPGSPKV